MNWMIQILGWWRQASCLPLLTAGLPRQNTAGWKPAPPQTTAGWKPAPPMVLTSREGLT